VLKGICGTGTKKQQDLRKRTRQFTDAERLEICLQIGALEEILRNWNKKTAGSQEAHKTIYRGGAAGNLSSDRCAGGDPAELE
jgi:hypothetical protein